MEAIKNKLIMIKEESFEYNQKLGSSTTSIHFIKNIIKIQNEPEEVFYLIGLDTKNNILGFIEFGRGSIDAIITSQREIFKRVLLMNCSKFILTHNHPSGDATPSKYDIDLTNKVVKGGQILGIELIDHLIIGDKENYSLIAKCFI